MLVTIAVYHTLIDAHVAASLLESHGIQCFVADEVLGFRPIAVGGIRLQVSQSDVERSLQILSDQES